ncbi:hormogonium polysaccharide biosynthesis glycosyltransferase HpsE [Nostoc sp. FACHB-110]|uniref:hormogonium polysaccharide biosynthesis glycosyltransferase HpsE n=1 Tax=Nostoc sp. FACHB-110 TaxID=2692834 RepID=UPI00168730BF|nr:hormogonium polysaccharide biosynthesis glycosyltransferase HpsE [Nostoc sp. FACHB-110]MBD2439456.1 glycosyltransferase family 2 protein [Nostoc sp. FACHB-110]
MSIDFTVAIPTYNGVNRLPQVLERLQTQICLNNINWEIIIVDNNSTDGTAQLIKDYQHNWPKYLTLHYYFEPEQGLAFARNKAIQEAKSELVGFLDDDNLPANNWVISAYEFGKKNQKAGAYSSQIHGRFEVEPPAQLRPILFYLAINERGSQPILYEPQKKGFPPGAGLVIRRQVWKEYVPNRLFLVGRVGNSFLAGEDAEALSYIYQAGWEIWYNPAMVIEHIIPPWRLEKSYFISLLRGIGLSRYHLRMLLLKKWQRPIFSLLYLINDGYKLILYYLYNYRKIKTDMLVSCELARLIATFISPFYVLSIQLKKIMRLY